MENQEIKTKTLVAGLGSISFGSYIDEETKTPYLIINEYLAHKFPLGMDIPIEATPTSKTKIYFKSLKSISILESQLNRIKQELLNQQ